jgi:hypothetical protein
MVPVGIDSRPVSGATPVGGSIGAAIVVRSLAGDGLDDMVRARAEGGEGSLMSTACTMRSGAHARSVFGTGKTPGATIDVARRATKMVAWTVTDMTTKDDRR